jgi:sortase (surface protein transpeptidase)
VHSEIGPARFAVVLIGAGLLVVGLSGHAPPPWSPPPVPPASALGAKGSAVAMTQSRHGPKPMSRSVPVSVTVPAIGVNAEIIPLGLDSDGGVAVPPLTEPFLTSWFDRGPAPGQAGSAVLLGHVDAAGVGPAVFYRLGDLSPGDAIYITRRDGRTAIFRVTSVGLYSQYAFPAARVYAATRTPTLRLITCGGAFDWTTHLYLDRTIVWASFTGQR